MTDQVAPTDGSGMERAVRGVPLDAFNVYADDRAVATILGGHLDRLDEPLRCHRWQNEVGQVDVAQRWSG